MSLINNLTFWTFWKHIFDVSLKIILGWMHWPPWVLNWLPASHTVKHRFGEFTANYRTSQNVMYAFIKMRSCCSCWCSHFWTGHSTNAYLEIMLIKSCKNYMLSSHTCCWAKKKSRSFCHLHIFTFILYHTVHVT